MSSIDMKTRACTFAPREDRCKLPGHRPPRACAAQTAPAAKRAFGSITREPFRPLCQPLCQMGPPKQRITHAAPTVVAWCTACAWCACAHAAPGPTRAHRWCSESSKRPTLSATRTTLISTSSTASAPSKAAAAACVPHAPRWQSFRACRHFVNPSPATKPRKSKPVFVRAPRCASLPRVTTHAPPHHHHHHGGSLVLACAIPSACAHCQICGVGSPSCSQHTVKFGATPWLFVATRAVRVRTSQRLVHVASASAVWCAPFAR